MTFTNRCFTNRPAASSNGPRARAFAVRAVRALNATTADSLYAYAVTGSIFATLFVLASPHLEVFMRYLFHGKG
jgi:hypothetical protein